MKEAKVEYLDYTGLNPMLAKQLSESEVECAVLYRENIELKKKVEMLSALIEGYKNKIGDKQ